MSARGRSRSRPGDSMSVKIEEIMNELIAGNKRYIEGNLSHPRLNASRRAELENSQSPKAAILTCADSRVTPEFIFDQGIGDLFVVRNAGNVADATAIASLEYAVAHLAVRVVMVLGHDNCGAVNAAIGSYDERPDDSSNLGKLLDHMWSSVSKAKENQDDFFENACRLNAQNAVSEMVEKSEILRNAVEKDGLKLVPAFYRLKEGSVNFL